MRMPIWFCAHTPEPLAATPAELPTPTAAEPATTSAEMVCWEAAFIFRSPSEVMLESITKARVVAMAASPTAPKPSWPIRLRATDTPIEAPTPAAPPPAAMAADRAAMREEIEASLCAWITTSPLATTLAWRNTASVEPMTELMATAPAPEMATALPPPKLMAAEAATEVALMALRVMVN